MDSGDAFESAAVQVVPSSNGLRNWEYVYPSANHKSVSCSYRDGVLRVRLGLDRGHAASGERRVVRDGSKVMSRRTTGTRRPNGKEIGTLERISHHSVRVGVKDRDLAGVCFAKSTTCLYNRIRAGSR